MATNSSVDEFEDTILTPFDKATIPISTPWNVLLVVGYGSALIINCWVSLQRPKPRSYLKVGSMLSILCLVRIIQGIVGIVYVAKSKTPSYADITSPRHARFSLATTFLQDSGMLFLVVTIKRTLYVTLEPTEDVLKFLRRLWAPLLAILFVGGYVLEYLSFSCAVSNYMDKHDPKHVSNCTPGIYRGFLLVYICGFALFVVHHFTLSIYITGTRRVGQLKAHVPHCTVAVASSLGALHFLVPVVSTMARMGFYQQRTLEAAIGLHLLPEMLIVGIYLTLLFLVSRWDTHRRAEQTRIGSSVWIIWRREIRSVFLENMRKTKLTFPLSKITETLIKDEQWIWESDISLRWKTKGVVTDMLKSEICVELTRCDGWILPAEDQKWLENCLDESLVAIFHKANHAAMEVATSLVLKSCTMHSMLKKHVQPHTSDEVLVLDTEKTELKVLEEFGHYTLDIFGDRLLLCLSDIDGCLLEWDKGLPLSPKPGPGGPKKHNVADEDSSV